MDQYKINILTGKSRADKAINSLKGILLGINLDGEVNETELKELSQWAEDHHDLIERNPFREFMSVIYNTVNHEVPSKEAIEDLYWLCQKYEGDNYYYDGVTADLQTLMGLCHGILADGVIQEQEVFGLHEWLKDHEHLSSYWPYDELRSLVLSIVEDNKVDEDEKSILKAYFNEFVNLSNSDTASKIKEESSSVQISALCTSDPHVDFKDKTFCITGILSIMSRKELLNRIASLGGIPTNSITKKTDYLIVGDNGNQAWAFACYGRKVEKAMNLRKDGHTITLIHEFDFNDLLEDYEA